MTAQGLVITATGTEIGKTFITALITRELRDWGLPAHALKPISTGCRQDPEGRLWSPDGDSLILASGLDPSDWTTHQRYCLERFDPPLSPHLAARRSGRSLSLAKLTRYCRDWATRVDGYVLVEGIGGVMVPLREDRTFLEWLQDLGWPTLLVAGTYLGSFSHTLTAMRALSTAGIEVAGLILNQSAREPVSAEETRASLSCFLPSTPITICPQLEGVTSAQAPNLGADLGLAG